MGGTGGWGSGNDGTGSLKTGSVEWDQVKHVQLLKGMRCKMDITLNSSGFEEII